MKVYTRTGDNGLTSLYDGSRVAKSEQIFDVLGALDELASHIGVLCSKYNNESTCVLHNKYLRCGEFLQLVQRKLLNIGSIIATPNTNENTVLPTIQDEDVLKIEHEIDELDLFLKPLTVFLIMDGFNEQSAHAHVCRTVCRRAERELEKYGNVDRTISRFVNRLSDYFFTLARYSSEV